MKRYEIRLYDDYICFAIEPDNTPKKKTLLYQIKKAKGDKMISFLTYARSKYRFSAIKDDARDVEFEMEKLMPVYINIKRIDLIEEIPEKRSVTDGS